MKQFFGVTVLFGFVVFGYWCVAHAEGVFYRDLKLGDVGIDVKTLQQILNSDSTTAIAQAGVGSKGQETLYFGAKTKKAVIAFQEKYSAEILVPSGLRNGSGYVGSKTRAKLSVLVISVQKNDLVKSAQDEILPVSTLPTTPVSDASFQNSAQSVFPKTQMLTSGVNPNLEHLEDYINAVNQLAIKKNLSNEKITMIDRSIRDIAATTTDLRAKFMKDMKVAEAAREKTVAQKAETESNLLFRLGYKMIVALTTLVPKADAQLPFGGMLLFAIPCTCSEPIWQIFMLPANVGGPALIDVEPGAQMFANYSAPFALYYLGFYTPAIPACWMWAGYFCFDLPSEGLMDPFLGTSP